MNDIKIGQLYQHTPTGIVRMWAKYATLPVNKPYERNIEYWK